MSLPHEGTNGPKTDPVLGLKTEGHSVHIFKSKGRLIEVDIFEVAANEWKEKASPLGPLYSAVPLGGGRLQVVRLTL